MSRGYKLGKRNEQQEETRQRIVEAARSEVFASHNVENHVNRLTAIYEDVAT